MAQARAAQLAQQGLPPPPALSTVPGQARWDALLQQTRWALQQVSRELEECAEARSQQWRESERGECFSERLEAIQEVREGLEDLTENK